MHMGDDLIMDSSIVYGRRAKEEAIRNDQDRISELPDPIIHHIFSFLEAKRVAQSSILSKRWRNIWASAPCLHFDEEEFHNDDDSFTRFVDMFLRLRDPSDMHTLHLNLSSHGYKRWKHSVCSWIFHAVRHNISVLQVTVYYSRGNRGIRFLMPNCIFTCRSLETLSLRLVPWSELHFVPSKFTDLVKLKSLHLEELISNQNLVERILSASPLQDLRLEGCKFKTLDISSHALKRLTINESSASSGIQISTPSLIDLKLNHYSCAATFGQKLPSLVTAAIGESYFSDCGPCKFKIAIVKVFSNVRSLKIYFAWIECISEDFSQIPTFHNLKNLTLGGDLNVQVVANFLQRAHNLEKLLLDYEEEMDQFTEDSMAIQESRELSFVCRRLNLVEIQFLRCNTNKVLLELVNFLAANIENSTKLVITPDYW